MTHTAHTIGELVTRIQHDFLDTPELTLTPTAAEARFHLDSDTCSELLEFLADAGVLARVYRDGEHEFLLRRARRLASGARPEQPRATRSGSRTRTARAA